MPQNRLNERDYLHAAELRLALRTFLASSDRVIGKHGLTPKRYELLLLVKISEPAEATVSHLAGKLSIGQSATTPTCPPCRRRRSARTTVLTR